MLLLCGRGGIYHDFFEHLFRARESLVGGPRAEPVHACPYLRRKERAVPDIYAEQELRPH